MGTRFKKCRISLQRMQDIFMMHEFGKKNREIASRCFCSPSTVSDVLNHYKHPDERSWQHMSYYEKARYVHGVMKSNLRGKRRFRGHISSQQMRAYLIEKLTNDNWSPEIISNQAKAELGLTVSINTIYRYIKKSRKELVKYLYEKGKPRRQRVTHRRSRFANKERPKKKYIDERPENINSRAEFGHWEGDLVCGPKKGSGYVILSLIERKSRFKYFVKMPNAWADTTLAYVRAFFMQLPEEARKSITFDNGSEFSPLYMHKLEQLWPDFKVYYTETYSPQQKGSDEHANGRFRKYYPKKTDFSNIAQADIRHVTAKLNNRPMKLHAFRSPREQFDCELAQIKSINALAA